MSDIIELAKIRETIARIPKKRPNHRRNVVIFASAVLCFVIFIAPATLENGYNVALENSSEKEQTLFPYNW